VLEFSRSELDKIFKKKEKHIIETKKNFLIETEVFKDKTRT
jgi:hypothetical protein